MWQKYPNTLLETNVDNRGYLKQGLHSFCCFMRSEKHREGWEVFRDVWVLENVREDCSVHLKHSVNSPRIIRLQRNQYQSSQRSVYKPCLCTFSSASVKISSYGIEGNFIKAHEVWSKVSSYVIWFSFEVAKSFVKWSKWLQGTTTDFTFTFQTSTYSQDLIG